MRRMALAVIILLTISCVVVVLRQLPWLSARYECWKLGGALTVERGPSGLIAFSCDAPTEDGGTACVGKAEDCTGLCLQVNDTQCFGDKCPGECARSRKIKMYPHPPLEYDHGYWW